MKLRQSWLNGSLIVGGGALVLGAILTATTSLMNAPMAIAQTDGVTAGNDTPPASPVTPTFFDDDRAERFLRQTLNTLTSQDRLAFEADITFENVLEEGEKVQYAAYQSIVMERPSGLLSTYIGDLRNTEFTYDGSAVHLLNLDTNLYITAPAPETIDEMIEAIEEELDINIPLSNLLLSDPLPILLNVIERQEYLGMGLVNRTPAHHLMFIGAEVDWQLWVSDEYNPVPLKVVITYKTLPGAPQYTALLSNWDFAPIIAPNEFTFSAPEGAQELDLLRFEESSSSPE